MLISEEGVADGVEQEAAVVEAEGFALDVEHDVLIDVRHRECSGLESHHLPRDDQINGVPYAELRADDGD